MLDAAAPGISGAVAGQAVNDNSTLSPFAALNITDAVSTEAQTVTITLDTAAKGVLSNLGGGSYNASTGVYTFSGTAAAATTAVRGLVFTPTAQRVATATTETTTFTIAVTDAAGNSASDASSTVVSTAINHAPVLQANTYAITTTNEDTASGATTVSSMLGSKVSDSDVGALKGIAVTGASGKGSWQFSTDGVSWSNFGTVSTSAALLLDGNTQIRYNPGSKGGESAGISYVAWDKTSGTASANGARSTAAVGTTGGSTAFSSVSAQAQLEVTAVPRPVPPPPPPVIVVAPPPSPVVTPQVVVTATPVADVVHAAPPPAPVVVAAPIEVVPQAVAAVVAPPVAAAPSRAAPVTQTGISVTRTNAPTLTVDNGISDVSVHVGESVNFSVPKNAFAVSSKDAQVTLKATQADGSPLPNWLHFNPTTGTFSGTPPPGEKGDLHIKVDAVDNKGNQASTTFTVKSGIASGGTGEKGAAEKPAKPAAPQKQGALSGKDVLAALGLDGLRDGQADAQLPQADASAGHASHHANHHTASHDGKHDAGQDLKLAAGKHAPHLSAQLQQQAQRFAQARAATLQHVIALTEARRAG